MKMTKSIKKDFRREVKKSISRFISILLIVVLGVAFYSGIRSSMPAMQMTADAVYDKENFMDIRVVGTLGLTQNDLEALKEIEGVESVEGAYTTDFLCLANSSEIVTKVLAMPDTINDVMVSEGRYPEKYNECVVSREFLAESGFVIGDYVTLLTGNDDSIFDTLASETYQIVGIGSTSYFLNGDMGTSTIGDGVVDGYIVIPQEAYVTDIYTSLHITVAGARGLDCYSKEYTELVENVIEKIELIADRRCDIRYSEVRSQSNEMLEDAKNDYLEAEVTARNELAEAEQELLENEKKYEEENAILEENLILVQNAEANLPLYRQQVADGERELNKAKEDLAELEAEVKTAEEQYEAYINDPNKTEEQKQNAKDSLLLAQGMYELSSKALESKEEELNQAKKDLADLEYGVANKNELIAGSEKLQEAKEELERGREKFEIAKQDAEAELEDAKVRLAEAEREINSMQIPVWYVLNRDAVESYMSFKNDTQSIGAIGTVFPIIFFLVAALVALTTMTRMVEEQRTQIGTLKALGYSKFTIIGKYI